MKNTTRRTFLKSATAAGIGAMIIPNFISCAPNTKLRFAMIGVGGQGHASWSKVPKEDLVAMCDVDERMTKEAREAVPNAKWYTDFRKMFDEMGKEIDGTLTDEKGEFKITEVKLGTYELRFSFLGYQTKTIVRFQVEKPWLQ